MVQTTLSPNAPLNTYTVSRGRQARVSVVGEQVEEGRVIQVNKGDPYIVGTRELGTNTFVSQREIGRRVVGENVSQREIGVTYNELPERVLNQAIARRQSHIKKVDLVEEEPVIVEKIVEKEVEVLVERPVLKRIEVDVFYEVEVEKPIERIIEREVEVEKIVEKEIEKIVEVPIEKIVEVPIEEVVEKPVEVLEWVDVPVEKVVNRTVEIDITQPVYVDKKIDVPVTDIGLYPGAQVLPSNVTTQNVDRMVPRPVFTRRNNQQVITQQIENIITRPVEKLVER